MRLILLVCSFFFVLSASQCLNDTSCILGTTGGDIYNTGGGTGEVSLDFYCRRMNVTLLNTTAPVGLFSWVGSSTVRPVSNTSDCWTLRASVPYRLLNPRNERDSNLAAELKVEFHFLGFSDLEPIRPRTFMNSAFTFYVTLNDSMPSMSSIESQNVNVYEDNLNSANNPAQAGTDDFSVQSISSWQGVSAAILSVRYTFVYNTTEGFIQQYTGIRLPPTCGTYNSSNPDDCRVRYSHTTNDNGFDQTELDFHFPDSRRNWPAGLVYTYQLSAVDGQYTYMSRFVSVAARGYQPNDNDDDDGLSNLEIGLIAAGVTLAVIGIIVGIVYWIRSQRAHSGEHAPLLTSET